MRNVQVVYHDDPEGWWADSPDIEGYGVAGATLAEVRKLVREGIPFFLEAAQVKIDERFPRTVVGVKIETALPNVPYKTGTAAPVRSMIRRPAVPVRLSA